MNFKVVIPARYASTRLPAKPLADIGGKPMVAWVAERARLSGAAEVWVATDHAAVEKAAEAHGLNVLMTSPNHPTGTDRIAEVAGLRDWPDDAIVVNVQGDEPLIDPQLIREVAADLQAHPQAAIATACHGIHEREALFNPNVVKVVTDREGYALYFSRAPIPWARDAFARDEFPADLPVYRHIGIYAYRVSFLKEYGNLSQAPIEQFEALEQLRALWHGYRISVAVTDKAPPAGVDTPEDLERVRKILA